MTLMRIVTQENQNSLKEEITKVIYPFNTDGIIYFEDFIQLIKEMKNLQ